MQPVYVREGFLDRDYARSLIDRHGHDLIPSTTAGNILNDIRISEQRVFEDPDLMDLIVPEVFNYAVPRDFSLNGYFENMAIIRYKPGGKYDLHMDNSMMPGETRKVAVVIALNDDFEGGGTRWEWPNPRSGIVAPPSAGSIALFPSILLHAGLPVISGERWIIVTWAYGPPWS